LDLPPQPPLREERGKARNIFHALKVMEAVRGEGIALPSGLRRTLSNLRRREQRPWH
jgi:hypothetical protein